MNTLGAAGVKNGVTINAANLGAKGPVSTQGQPGSTPENNVANVNVNVDNTRSNISGGAGIAHEIKHTQDYVKDGAAKSREQQMEKERAAYWYNSNVFKGNDAGSFSPTDNEKMSTQSTDAWCEQSKAPGC